MLSLYQLDGFKTRTYYWRLGLGAQQVGDAELGRTGCQQNCVPRKHASPEFSKATEKRLVNPFLEARPSDILFKPEEKNKNQRLTSG